ncbi:hypothetical protein DRN73_02585 [Candidatus Pacearchaeota archaeon]|nr:MAG: hypothetical protein DRN73_02585 [Candidatus Pacearchaeota archaeon]
MINLIMKRSVIFLLLGILVIGVFFAQQNHSISPNISGEVVKALGDNESVRVMIKMKNSVVGKRGIASDIKQELKNSIKIRHEFQDEVSAIINKSELEILKNNPNVKSVEIVKTRSIALQDSVPLINASSTWNLKEKNNNLTGKGQTVCVLDTGVDFTHPDLNEKNLTCIIDCISGGNCVENCSATDGNGHGTHVAGIASANGSLKGLAPGANLISVQVCDSSGSCGGDDIKAGIQWCVDNKDEYNISVISMSLGAICKYSNGTYTGWCHENYCNSIFEGDAIDNAVAKNISVIIAAGNSGNTTHISEPACYENAIPVGSIRKDDSTFDYNRNSLVELIAPGYSINSTIPSSSYGTMSGTSMATPHVAGAFAIINQFLKLENKTKTPSEIEDALNDSGKRIYDSGSGLNYSRIDVYSAIINIDEFAPEINMNSPEDNLVSLSQNISFNCSADDVELNNLSFYLWNSSNILINQTNLNTTDNFLEIDLNLTLENGTYKWACESYDDKGNYNISSNYSLKIGEMIVNLISPSDNYYTSENQVNFSCNVTDSVANLTNNTLMIWNSSSLVYNETVNISGKTNQSNFNYNLSNEESYDWNCFFKDENSNLIFADSNYTITYDNTSPVVTLISPEDNGEEDSGTVHFKYNVSDMNEIKNCSLILDDDIEKTDSSIQRNHTEDISVSLSSGSYEWKIQCIDAAENSKTTSEWNLDIVSSDDNSSDDSETDDTTTEEDTDTEDSPSMFIIPDNEFKRGASKLMKKDDLMKFTFKNETHTIKLDNVSEEEAKIIISSNPLTVILNVGESKKVNIDNDKTYDLKITYNEYKNSLANISIKEINETIPTRQIQIGGNQSSENKTSEEKTSITGKGIIGFFKNKKVRYILIGVILFLIGGLVIHKEREKIVDFIANIKHKKAKKKKVYKDI